MLVKTWEQLSNLHNKILIGAHGKEWDWGRRWVRVSWPREPGAVVSSQKLWESRGFAQLNSGGCTCLPFYHSCLGELLCNLFIFVLALPQTESPSMAWWLDHQPHTPTLSCSAGGVWSLGCHWSAQGWELHSGLGVMIFFLTQSQISQRSAWLFLSLLRAILSLISRNCIGIRGSCK